MAFQIGTTDVTAQLKPGQTMHVGAERNWNIPPYFCMASNTMKHKKVERYDGLAMVLADLPTPATWLFWNLVHKRNPDTNVAIFKSKDQNESKRITKAYKVLSQKNLVKRIKRQHYLINPTVVIPIYTYDTVLDHWHIL
jgi:hypothetical protein